MRWFIVLLVVANIILFFWVKQQSRVSVSDPIAPPDIGHLELTGEKADTVAESGLGSQEQVVVPVDTRVVAKAESPKSGVLVDAEIAERQDERARPLEQRSSTAVAASEPPASQAAAASESAKVDPSRGSVSPAEQAADVAPVQADASRGLDQAIEPSGLSARCYRVGPLTPEQADRLLNNVPPSMRVVSDVVEAKSSVEGYYVLVPPLPSRAEGRRIVNELAAAGEKDTWLLSNGPRRNAVSLGYFSREAGAKRRAASIAAKGFETTVQPNVKRVEQRWIEFTGSTQDLRSKLNLPASVSVRADACRSPN